MENTYIIVWKSRFGASSGQGKKRFSREEAEQLARELNQDHPSFIHEPVNLHPTERALAEAEMLTDTTALQVQEGALA